MQLGRKIYYDIVTGSPILDTGQWDNAVKEKTVDEDISSFPVLSERNRDSFDVIKLEYGQYQQDFAECNGFMVDPATKQLKFSYPDPNDPEPQEPVFQRPLTEQVKDLRDRQDATEAAIIALMDVTVMG